MIDNLKCITVIASNSIVWHSLLTIFHNNHGQQTIWKRRGHDVAMVEQESSYK